MLATIPVLLLLVAAPFQTEDAPGKANSPPTAFEFHEQPLFLDTVGLSVLFPEGFAVVNDSEGTATVARILPPGAPWSVSVRVTDAADSSLTVHDAATTALALLQGSVGVMDPEQKQILETNARVLDRFENLSIGSGRQLPAERIYVAIPSTHGQRISGLTFFRPTATKLVVFELSCPEVDFPTARPMYETIVAAASFDDLEQATQSRAAAVAAAADFLGQLTDSSYESLFAADERWFRLYTPATSGAEADDVEVGYRGIKFWRGAQGEIDPARSPDDYTVAEQAEGYLCRICVRILDESRPIDTVGYYFMIPDRSQEMWTVKTTVRDPASNKSATFTEMGARKDNDMTIRITQPGQPTLRMQPVVPISGYVTQVETFALPYLLMADCQRNNAEKDFAFYAYQSASEAVSLRRDSVGRDPALASAWTLKTRFRDELEPQVSIFNERAELTKTTLADGRCWEPRPPEDLMRLWKAKGLPTEPIVPQEPTKRRRRSTQP